MDFGEKLREMTNNYVQPVPMSNEQRINDLVANLTPAIMKECENEAKRGKICCIL